MVFYTVKKALYGAWGKVVIDTCAIDTKQSYILEEKCNEKVIGYGGNHDFCSDYCSM